MKTHPSNQVRFLFEFITFKIPSLEVRSLGDLSGCCGVSYAAIEYQNVVGRHTKPSVSRSRFRDSSI